MRVAWTRSALADVEAIQDHVAQDNPAAAYELAGDILDRTTRLLADNPMVGRIGRVSGTRELVVSGTRYVVAYRLRDRVEVLAVLHGARRWPDAFYATRSMFLGRGVTYSITAAFMITTIVA